MAKKKTKKISKKTKHKKAPAKTVQKGILKKSSRPSPKLSKKVTVEVMDSSNEDFVNQDNEETIAPVNIESVDLNNIEEIESFDLPQIESTAGTSSSVATLDPVTKYLNEIKKYPLLSREQEQVIARKYYETKDPQFAQMLVTSNLRFVVKIAAEYSKFGSRMIDLIQEGNMGLMHAVKDFNPYKGVKLITYAVWWIRGHIQEYLMKQFSMVKIGTTQNQKRLFYQLQKQKEALDKLSENPEQLRLISTKMGIPEDEVKIMAQRLSGRDISLDRPVDDETPTSLLDFQRTLTDSPDDELSRREQVEKLMSVIEKLRPSLSEKEIIILDERLLNDEPLTLQEIGDKYKITREAVRQAEVRVMKKIKDLIGEL